MVSFHKMVVLHGQGRTDNWDAVRKMEGEGVAEQTNLANKITGGYFILP